MVIGKVAGQDSAQVSFAQDENVVETLAPDRTDQALGERILPGAVRRREDFVDAHALHAVPKELAEDLVTITQEIGSTSTSQNTLPPRSRPGTRRRSAGQLRPGRRSFVDGELVAQGQVLNGELAVAAEEDGEEPKQVEQDSDHREIVAGSGPADQLLGRRPGFGDAHRVCGWAPSDTETVVFYPYP
jgi:hypothetical protein